MPFQMTENTGRLLPLRMKISPSSISFSEQCCPVETAMKGTVATSVLRGIEGSSIGTRSDFRRASSPSELTLQCPLGSVAVDCNEEDDKRHKLIRKPSEHFLEVLQQNDKLPQIVTPTRSRNGAGEFNLVSNCPIAPVPPPSRSQKTLKLQSVSSARSSSPDSGHADTESCSKGDTSVVVNEGEGHAECKYIKKSSEKNYVRQTHSLPAIQPTQNQRCQTSGADSESKRLNLRNRAFRQHSFGDTVEFPKNSEELYEEESGYSTENTRRVVENDDERDSEKLAMIYQWLAQCEKERDDN